MKKFIVRVVRECTEYADVTIEAINAESANYQAIDIARSTDVTWQYNDTPDDTQYYLPDPDSTEEEGR